MGKINKDYLKEEMANILNERFYEAEFNSANELIIRLATISDICTQIGNERFEIIENAVRNRNFNEAEKKSILNSLEKHGNEEPYASIERGLAR